jgi:hypothetical protein
MTALASVILREHSLQGILAQVAALSAEAVPAVASAGVVDDSSAQGDDKTRFVAVELGFCNGV